MKMLPVYRLVASLACSPALYSVERDPDTALVYEIGAKGWDGQIAAIKKLSAETKRRLISVIKSPSFPEDSRKEKEDTLVFLGDEETIQKQAALAHHGDHNEWLSAIELLETLNEPRVIAAMAPALFVEDPAALRIGLPSSRAEVTAGAMFRMLPETPGFSGEIGRASCRERV